MVTTPLFGVRFGSAHLITECDKGGPLAWDTRLSEPAARRGAKIACVTPVFAQLAFFVAPDISNFAALFEGWFKSRGVEITFVCNESC